MRIDSGTIGMDSARLFKSSVSTRYSLETNSVSANTTTGGQLTSLFDQFLSGKDEYSEKKESSGNVEACETDIDENKTETQTLWDALERLGSNTKTKFQSSNVQSRNSTLEQFQKLHQKMIFSIMELLFGRRIKNREDATVSTDELMDATGEGTYELVTQVETLSTMSYEYESTSFSASGVVKTDDGREIDVNVSISMSRRFMEYTSVSSFSSSYQLTDPLVINLHDAPAGLSDLHYFFDLDGDGTDEYISGLKEGSGFLALDKNDDGKINDGSELFGTKSGDGFKDLAAYDKDGNGWIDENDEIFSLLKIWTKDMDGNDILYTLKEANVGAIYLDNKQTQFSMISKKTEELEGMIRKTGVFLYEDGTAGTMQHIDLVS